MKIIIINGFPQSGKDTFVDFVREKYPAINLWTSTPAKEAFKLLGWDGVTKNESIREVLSAFKRLSNAMFDHTVAYIQERVNEIKVHLPETEFIFIHCREPAEIDRLKYLLKADTLLIYRFISDRRYTNASDNDVLDYFYDYKITNNGTLQDLRYKAYTWSEGVINNV